MSSASQSLKGEKADQEVGAPVAMGREPWLRRMSTWVLLAALGFIVAAGVATGISVAVLQASAPSFDTLDEVPAGEAPVFVSAAQLEAMMREPAGVAVLDARPRNQLAALEDPAWGKSISGSQRVGWTEFTGGSRGELLPPEEQAAIFSAKGVSDDVPVVVYGAWSAPRSWGEEGRIYWQLDYLGHRNVSILYGGIYAWLEGGHKAEANPQAGAFEGVTVQDSRRALADNINAELSSGVANGSIVVLDARDENEFDGATPYGSARGGHIPGAKSYPWRSVFDAGGNLRPAAAITSDLAALGVRNDTVIIPYCTGGIRSGYLYAVLRWAGLNRVANYDGSWWEWAGNPNLPVGTATGGSSFG
mmetsp:Transcript_42200/g.107908  ORF Transcript_42200/g.107908 Transcript_42200/m.107908 type:complete len:361 (+) Transcript_42200:242-1324(+)|eukprot:jgi/Tetstr1/465413/TSEL_010097.t1